MNLGDGVLGFFFSCFFSLSFTYGVQCLKEKGQLEKLTGDIGVEFGPGYQNNELSEG